MKGNMMIRSERVKKWGVTWLVAAITAITSMAPAWADDDHGPVCTSRADDAEGKVPSLPAQDVALIDGLFQAAVAQGIVGITVSVCEPGRGQLMKSYGKADLATGEALTPQHNFRIGSITKTVVATAVLELVDMKRLSLDDKVSKFVTGVPNGELISVRQLLNMTSGLYEFSLDPLVAGAYYSNQEMPGWTPRDVLTVLQRHDPTFPPGQGGQYNNSGYVLLGMILEKVSGMPVRDLLHRFVLNRARMFNTDMPTSTSMKMPYAHGYDVTTFPPKEVSLENPLFAWTAGNLVSTAADLTRWAPALGDGYLLSKDTQAQRTAYNYVVIDGVPYGYGLGIMKVGDWVGHVGGLGAYKSLLLYRPASKTTIVILLNTMHQQVASPVAQIFYTIATYLHPGSLPPVPTP
jgi:D-alanyl-D-alanine carboxypeptidase